MLLQRDENGNLHLVYYFSKKTSDTESKYHSSRLELMAIVWSLDRLRSWLIGVHVIVVTNCQALVFMNRLKTTNPQITRWFDLLQDFDIEVRHRPGTTMSHVDALSRAPTESSSDTMDDVNYQSAGSVGNHNRRVCSTAIQNYVRLSMTLHNTCQPKQTLKF